MGSEENYLFENKIVGGVVPREYVPGVEKGVADALKQGFIAGLPDGAHSRRAGGW